MKEVTKFYLLFAGQLLGVIWRQILTPMLYLLVMWGAAVTGLFLFLKDFWQAAGIVSSFALYQIIQSEFTREFFGTRNGQQDGLPRKAKG